MRSVMAVYEDGQIRLPEGVNPKGRMNVIITFLEDEHETVERAQEPGKLFVSRWSGVLEGVKIDGWKEQRADDLERKHS